MELNLPRRAQIPPPPGWLIAKLTPKTKPLSSKQGPGPMPFGFSNLNSPWPIAEGERNQRLFKIACGLRRSGQEYDEILAELGAINDDPSRMVAPLQDSELQQIAKSAMRYQPDPNVAKAEARDLPLNDTGNAQRLVQFAHQHGIRIRYVFERKTWLIWISSAHRWVWDKRGLVVEIAKKSAANIYAEATKAAADGDASKADRLAKHARASMQLPRLQAAIVLAESIPGVATVLSELDANNWHLGCKNGVVDLQTQTFRDGCPDDLITMSARVQYDRTATCPHWENLLLWAMNGDTAMVEFLQRVFGIALTGDRSIQAFLYFFGYGRNAKSTIVNAVREILGTYATTVQAETFMLSRNGRDGASASPDLAKLAGKRFIAANELEDGHVLAESQIKQLTGGDLVSARFLHCDFFDFIPKFLLLMSANHLPIVRGTDYGIWRRIWLVPFTQTVTDAQCDPDLSNKLRAEYPGILNWMLDGLHLWLAQGKKLNLPQQVRMATANFRAESDLVGRWITDCCTIKAGVSLCSNAAYSSFRVWCSENGYSAYSKNRLTRNLAQRGIPTQRRGGGRGQDYVGIELA